MSKNIDSDVDEKNYYTYCKSENSSPSSSPQMCFIPTYILSNETRKSMKSAKKNENFKHHENKRSLLFPILQTTPDMETTSSSKDENTTQSWSDSLPLLKQNDSKTSNKLLQFSNGPLIRNHHRSLKSGQILQDSSNLSYSDSNLRLPSATFVNDNNRKMILEIKSQTNYENELNNIDGTDKDYEFIVPSQSPLKNRSYKQQKFSHSQQQLKQSFSLPPLKVNQNESNEENEEN